MDKKVIMKNSWTLQIAPALKLPPPFKKKKSRAEQNASPFLLHSGPGTFAHHGPRDSCHTVKIPGLLSECSLLLKNLERRGRKFFREPNLQRNGNEELGAGWGF